MNIRHRLGYWLLRKGCSLLFITEEDRTLFKEKINSETWFGSFIETGNHLVSYVNPVDDYTVQSVLNVLRHKEPNYGRVVSRRVEYYKDEWIGEDEHYNQKGEYSE